VFRRLALTFGTVAIASAILVSAPQDAPLFRTGVNVVTIDVTAVDRDGKPVKGLTAADFVVTLEGQPRPVQTVAFIEFGSGSAGPAPSATAPGSAASTSRGTVPLHERRVIVMLFDDLSLKAGKGKSLTVAAERTLAQFGPDDLIGVAATSGLVKSVNPTTDREAVRAALKKMVGSADEFTRPFFISASEATEIDRDFPKTTVVTVAKRECPILNLPPDVCQGLIRTIASGYATQLRNRVASQMAAYRTIMAALRPFKGAKVIITLSDGVATMSDVGVRQTQLEPIMREAAESGVRFYAMTEETDYADAAEPNMERNKARIEEDRRLFDGIAEVASAGGGEAFHVIGQGDRLFERIEAETSGVYRLAVDAPAGADKARFLSAKVSVKRPGVTVRASRRALSVATPPEVLTTDQRLRNALASGGIDREVPVTIGTALRRDERSGQLQLGVNVEMPADVAGPVMTMFSLVNDAGQSVQAGRRELPAPGPGENYFFVFPLSVSPGKYSLRVAAADATGHVGAAEEHVAAELGHIGVFAASGLLTGWSGASGVQKLLTLDLLPAEATTLHVSLELYANDQAGMSTDIAMRFSITKVGEAKALIERDTDPSATGLTMLGGTDFDAASLGPGAYTITATVLQAGEAKGAVSTLVRKR
jgi:VWFA-related protein